MSAPALQPVRVGFIGAGGICRQRHLPNLRTLENVQIVAVANRTRQSSEAVAKEFSIPDVHEDWRDLIARDDLDAVFIGTWPYRHREMSVAALEAGKHVFCQARMAMDLAEARAMLQAAVQRPDLVNMVCPPPHRMPWEPFIRQVIHEGQLGDLYEVRLVNTDGSNLGPLTWRQRVEFSGRQFLAVGIWAETLHAWLGEYELLSAQLATPIAVKLDDVGEEYRIDVPQVGMIHGVLKCGVSISEHHSGLSPYDPQNTLTVIGSKGAMRVSAMKQVELATEGGAFAPAVVPDELRRPWRVEQDFIEAVRLAMDGAGPADRPVSPDFAEATRYMKKVQAIHLSAERGEAVLLETL